MEQFVLFPAFKYYKTSLKNWSVTKQELPKYQAEKILRTELIRLKRKKKQKGCLSKQTL